MAVKADRPNKERLLDLVADHLLANGVAAVTLRGMARAVGSNNRMLLYYFGSKEELIVAAVKHAVLRFPSGQAFGRLDASARPLAEALDEAWREISSDANLPWTRLFFEMFGLAAHQPGRFDEFLDIVGHLWPSRLEAAFRRHGCRPAAARQAAAEVVALWRGLQMDLISTGERTRINRVHGVAIRRIVTRPTGR